MIRACSYIFVLGLLFLMACTNQTAVQVGKNAFFYNGKVYQVTDNNVELLCDLNSDSIAKVKVISPDVRSFGKAEIEGESDAFSEVAGVFRAGSLNYKFELKSFKDLFEKYTDGKFSLIFRDKNGFPVIAADVPILQLTDFEYTGHLPISTADWLAIDKYSVSADLTRKEEPKKTGGGTYNDNSWY